MRIRIEPGVYFWWTFLLLNIPVRWFLAAAMSAVFHELCHIVVVLLWKGNVEYVSIGLMGAKMQGNLPTKQGELSALAAGPAGSMSLVLFCRIWPELAICGFFQGLFNLMPLSNLDGGAMLLRITEKFCPQYSRSVTEWAQRGTLVILGAVVVQGWRRGIFPVFFPIVVFLRIIREILGKIPCKPGRIGVQ